MSSEKVFKTKNKLPLKIIKIKIVALKNTLKTNNQ